MGFTSGGAKIWPIAPDWANGIQETLRWSTDVLQASATAVTHHRGLRIGPQRGFTFEVLSQAKNFRAAQMLLAGHGGPWMLPIWPDQQRLGATLASGASSIPCLTAGFDFVAGGKALLHAGINAWEVVEVDTVAADHVGLTGATAAAYGPGSRLLPLRRALIEDGAETRLRNAHTSRCSLAFSIDENCDWPALDGLTEYLTHPVLEVRPDESEDPSYTLNRLVQTVDYGTARPFRHDLPGISLRAQKNEWKLIGRDKHTWFRSLLYTLEGRRVPMWVPSFAQDIKPVAAIAGGSASMSIEWAGYTLFGKGKPNRRDLCVELVDGTRLYRRITDAVEAGDAETLTLSASLDAGSIAPERIRQASIMSLCTLASDEIEFDHGNNQDGDARVTTGWQAVVPDV